MIRQDISQRAAAYKQDCIAASECNTSFFELVRFTTNGRAIA